MLLTLAPGLRVVRRGHDHVQVGLYDDRVVVLPRSDATAHVLSRIHEGEPIDLDVPGVAATVTRLVASGCALPHTSAQSSAQPLAPSRSRRRAETRIEVVGHLGQPGPDPVPLLAAAGLSLLGRGPEVPAASRGDVVLLISRGEPDRERLDPWLRAEVPYLVVRLVDAGVVVGPFVLPGRSACLRCTDAHVADSDPDHLSVLTRYAEASRRRRGDGSDDVEPALVSLGLAWAVRDLVAHADGRRPSTCSRTVRLGPEPDRERHTSWSMHPECACCWRGHAHR